MTGIHPDALLRAAFEAAVDAAQPSSCLPACLPPAPRGRTVVVGAGKAAAAMASTLDRHWTGPLEGVVVTATGHGLDRGRIEVLEAGHPVPTADGQRAAMQILERVATLGADDLVICLLSGGGSALTPLPVEGLTLAGKQRITADLLRSGASIGEMNCVRRHLSAFKGGRLAAACHPARVVTLAISDVPGDDPVDIASGPTVGDPSTCADALAVLERYRIDIDAELRQALERGRHESVKPGDPRLSGASLRIIASASQSLAAASAAARSLGVAAHVLSDRIEGEARDVGKVLAGVARHVELRGQPFATPCLLLSGGETTVTVRGDGRGGRNAEFLLAFGLALGSASQVHALAADTDGIDGTDAVAGAFWRPDTLARAHQLGLAPRDFLDRNDAHTFFETLGDGIVTGPTRTNVNDFRAILVLSGPPPAGSAG
jgi:hydroxypyruvate reductase